MLGPPKLNFNSTSRNQNRSNDNSDGKNADPLGHDLTSPSRTSFKDRSFKSLEDDLRERDQNDVLGLRSRREEEGWTSVRGRNNRGQESERWPRGERDRDRDRDRLHKDGENSEAPLRRNGIGRGRVERPWREEVGSSTADSGRQMGGWRDRDRDRDRDSVRRGRFEQKTEEEPEWMLDESKEEPSKPARTQEDFQRWMESQKISKANPPSNDDKIEPTKTPEAPKPPKESVPKPSTPLAAGNAFGSLFGAWDEKKLDGLKSDVQSVAKAAASKPKTSKFFPKEAVSQPPEPERPSTATPSIIDDTAKTTDEDREGFQRILHMLNSKAPGEASSSIKASPQEPQTARERGFPPQLPNGSQIDDAEFLAEVLARQGIGRDVKSVPPSRAGLPVSREPEPGSHFFPSDFLHSPNGRGENITPRNGPFAHPPEVGGPPNAGLNQLDHEREFLLSLMNSRPHPQHARAVDPELEEMFQRQQMQVRTQPPPLVQGPPPGYWGPPAQQRRGPQAPPGFPDMEEPPMIGLQRRKTTDIPPRSQMTNMGIPSQHAMPPDWMKNPPPGMALPNHPERPNIAPPPGFPAPPVNRAPPPGFLNGPPIPANMNSGPLNHPGPRGGPPGMFPGPMGPGFFGPNGPAQPGMHPPGPPGFMMGPGGRGTFNDFPPLPNDMARGRGHPPPGFPTI